MFGLSFGHLVLLVIVVLVIFGAGKLPSVMGDLGKGIRSFKAGLTGDDKLDDKDAKMESKELPPSDKSA